MSRFLRKLFRTYLIKSQNYIDHGIKDFRLNKCLFFFTDFEISVEHLLQIHARHRLRTTGICIKYYVLYIHYRYTTSPAR